MKTLQFYLDLGQCYALVDGNVDCESEDTDDTRDLAAYMNTEVSRKEDIDPDLKY